MFSRFRKSLPAQGSNEKMSLGAGPEVLALPMLLAVILYSGCTSQMAEPDGWVKKYIDPPRQKQVAASDTALRVCADPNNLPFSNSKREGFENKIAEVVGRELNAPVEYTWWAQRRGYIRNSLKAGLCDVMVGVPTGLDMVLTTRPYYRSTYVFVTRSDGPRIHSLDDIRRPIVRPR